MSKEYTFTTEAAAKSSRRNDINAGRSVSLIAFDPSRNLYVYDRY